MDFASKDFEKCEFSEKKPLNADYLSRLYLALKIHIKYPKFEYHPIGSLVKQRRRSKAIF